MQAWGAHNLGITPTGVYFLDILPVFPCIPPVSPCNISRYLSISSHFAAHPLYPTVSHCIHVSTISRLYLTTTSSCICCICCIPLYLTVSHRISPLRKRDITKNTLQGGLPPRAVMSKTKRDVPACTLCDCIYMALLNTIGQDLLAGGFPRVLFPPLWCFPPGCLGDVPPPVFRRRFLYDDVATP